MSFEVLDLMVRLWAQETQDLDADFWSLGPPHDQLPWLGHDILPLQKPYPPIAIAGLAPGSRNHKLAGEKGYLPISSSIDPDGSITALHWDAVVEGAERSGLSPDRGTWRIIRDIYVAPTDAEARDLAINGTMGRCWREFLLPDYLGLGPILKRDPSLPDAAIDAEYLADNIWLVGSPETVADRVIELYRRTGGFGYLLAAAYDALDEAETWERSLRLLAQEVGPACNQWIATSQNTVLSEAVR